MKRSLNANDELEVNLIFLKKKIKKKNLEMIKEEATWQNFMLFYMRSLL